MQKSTTAQVTQPGVLSPDLFSTVAQPRFTGKVNTGKVIIGAAYVPKPRNERMSLDAWRLQERMLAHGMPAITSMERISRPPRTFIGRIAAALYRAL